MSARRSAFIGLLVTLGPAMAILASFEFHRVAPLSYWLKALSYDIPFALRDDIPVDEVVIISMDEDSHRELGQNEAGTWNRNLHVELLEQVLALGARAVVFDISFDRPWLDDPDVDRRFATALKKAQGKAVLAVILEEHEDEAARAAFWTPLLPIPLLGAVAPWGVAQLPIDPDQTIRRHYTSANYTGLSWKAAELLGQAPTDPLRHRWINYYGQRGKVNHKSYHQVLRGTNLPAGLLSNKVVYVGRNPVITPRGTDREDEYRTPYTRWTGHTSTGVEIQATVFLNLVRGDWLEELPRWIEWLVIIGAGAVFGLGLTFLRPWIAVWVALLGAGAFMAGDLWLFSEKRLWFPWMLVSAVQIPVALGWSIITHTKTLSREKELLKRKLGREKDAATQTAGTRMDTGELLMSPERAAAVVVSAEPQRKPAIPDHAVLRCVGRGSYGEVWLARDIVGSYHAVKAIYRDRFPHERPFEREFKGIQKYSPISRTHPGWVHILHVGRNEAEGYFFYIMEAGDDETTGQQIEPERYVPKTLGGELRKRGRLPLEEAVNLSVALADALEHLHKHSLIHRDIKPSNIIFVNGQPKFTDIGLVTEFSAAGRDVSYLGTEGYIAPEGPGTPAADVYSLGMVIYEASSGRDRLAFPEFPTDIMDRTSEEGWQQFLRIILKTCEPEPRARYSSAGELHAALLQLQSSLQVRSKT